MHFDRDICNILPILLVCMLMLWHLQHFLLWRWHFWCACWLLSHLQHFLLWAGTFGVHSDCCHICNIVFFELALLVGMLIVATSVTCRVPFVTPHLRDCSSCWALSILWSLQYLSLAWIFHQWMCVLTLLLLFWYWCLLITVSQIEWVTAVSKFSPNCLSKVGFKNQTADFKKIAGSVFPAFLFFPRKLGKNNH